MKKKTHGSSTELHYYANINDDKKVQGNSIEFNLQLWHLDRYWWIFKIWDNKLLSGNEIYSINTPGSSQTLNVQNAGYSLDVKVKTIGVEKANTIAIYETNGTVFNGHYQQQERMNIIQLYVNDNGAGTPFEEGSNTILIPTSLFTETIFNAYVQNETLNETAIYSSDEEIFKFISVGRDGNTEQASSEIDFIIIRFDISSQDAMEVLNLLLTCLVNDTTNETAVVYSYVSTKENSTSASMMNLHASVLGLIPWFLYFSDSPQGSKPKGFEEWLWAPLIAFGKAFIGVFIVIGMAFVAIFLMIVDFFVEIFMDILPILGYILWLIIKALILIFIWITFALTLIFLTIGIGAIALVLLPFAVAFGANLIYTINAVSYKSSSFSFDIGYIIYLEYDTFFGFIVQSHFTSKPGDKAINLEDAYNILISARRGLLSFKDKRIKNMDTGIKNQKSLRVQFIDFFANPSLSAKRIYFYSSIVQGINNRKDIFSLIFNKDDFPGKFTQMNGNTDSDWWSAFDLNFVEDYNKKIIDKRSEVLRDLIISQPEGSREVRIFIGQNLGISSDLSTDYGHQYIMATKDSSEWIPKTTIMGSRNLGASYVDISLEDGTDLRWEMTKLRYLILLSMSTEPEFKIDSGRIRATKNYRDFIFIIKKAGSTVDGRNYIAYFNHKFIRSSRELLPYSIDGTPAVRRRGFRKIDLTNVYGGAYWSNSFSTRWVEHNSFIPIWTATGTLRIGLFTDYRNFINNYKTRGIP